MKRLSLFVFIVCLASLSLYSQVLTGVRADKIVRGTDLVMVNPGSAIPLYFRFRAGHEVNSDYFALFLKKTFRLSSAYDYKLTGKESDENGEMLLRYQLVVDGIPVHDGHFIIHIRNNKIYSVNGNIPDHVEILNEQVLDESSAIEMGIASVGAELYKWQIPGEEQKLKELKNDQSASYFPVAEMVAFPADYPLKTGRYRLTYKVNVYAQQPLSKSDQYIDATDGHLVFSMNQLISTDVTGTAVTKYSGTQTITTDSYNGSYRLRETGRGQGVETYNLEQGSSPSSAVDFTDNDNYWNNVNSSMDEAATDAHWAAEMTYDFYKQNFNRNSIDGNGFKLTSYVHYQSNFDNAFWDGSAMYYGDGSSNDPFTTVDICGHEITHGLTSFTANLDYAYESGALNEGYSDVMGTAIEFFAKPALANWTMGEDIGTPFRSLSDPNTYGLPDTYQGLYWTSDASDNGGVHTNSGVLGYWFYLCSQGGSGTNDINHTYNVNAIGMSKAQAVAYRTLTHYLINSSGYEEARFYSILSAIDLYGGCSAEVQAVTDAWYAVGIGPAYVDTVVSNFNADFTHFCAPPANVNFENLAVNGTSFLWNFGDGVTSAEISPFHTYSANGTYNVTLSVNGGTCGNASYTASNFISVDPSNDCIVVLTPNSTINQTGCSGQLFDSGGNGNYQDQNTSTVIIQPIGASSISLTFTLFAFEQDYDYLYIYDGASTTSPLIGQFTGFSLPNGGTIVSSGGALTIVQESDQAVNYAGFAASWICCGATVTPKADFAAEDSITCTGIVQFNDHSFCNVSSWQWDFGDGTTSNLQNPLHSYVQNGVFDVRLIVANGFSNDTLIRHTYVSVDLLPAPTVTPVQNCGPASVTLTASGQYNLEWYDSPAGGNLIFNGPNFTTPYLTQTTHYYVLDKFSNGPEYTGAPVKTSNGGYYNSSSSWGVLFNCYVPLILNKVKVYATGDAVRNIQLHDKIGNLLQSLDIDIPDGESDVILNFQLPVGDSLLLSAPAYCQLWRDNSGAAYPYEITGKISIWGSNVQPPANPLDYYYYFYNWEVQQPECTSARVECTAYILTVPVAGFAASVNGSIAGFTDQSVDAINYSWNFGDGSTSNEQNPVHSYSAVGNYTVTLVISNDCGSDTISKLITITQVGISELPDVDNVALYPNPANDHVNIELNSLKQQDLKFEILDITGKLTYLDDYISDKGQLTSVLNISGFPAGLYLLRISGNDHFYLLKFLKE